jgi:hypothetical protein
MLARRYAPVTVPKLHRTTLGSVLSGLMISSMRKFKSAQPSKLHRQAIIAEKKLVMPFEPWNDFDTDKLLWKTEESEETNIIATMKRTITRSNLREVRTRCNITDSRTPAQFSRVKNIMHDAAAHLATEVSP